MVQVGGQVADIRAIEVSNTGKDTQMEDKNRQE